MCMGTSPFLHSPCSLSVIGRTGRRPGTTTSTGIPSSASSWHLSAGPGSKTAQFKGSHSLGQARPQRLSDSLKKRVPLSYVLRWMTLSGKAIFGGILMVAYPSRPYTILRENGYPATGAIPALATSGQSRVQLSLRVPRKRLSLSPAICIGLCSQERQYPAGCRRVLIFRWIRQSRVRMDWPIFWFDNTSLRVRFSGIFAHMRTRLASPVVIHGYHTKHVTYIRRPPSTYA